MLPAEPLDLGQPAARQHQETDRGHCGAGLRSVRQDLVENFTKPRELFRALSEETALGVGSMPSRFPE